MTNSPFRTATASRKSKIINMYDMLNSNTCEKNENRPCHLPPKIAFAIQSLRRWQQAWSKRNGPSARKCISVSIRSAEKRLICDDNLTAFQCQPSESSACFKRNKNIFNIPSALGRSPANESSIYARVLSFFSPGK